MTKEITKANIIQEIQDKFKFRDFESDRFLFSETVVPVYNVETHLLKREVDVTNVSITSAAAFPFFVVPEKERWIVDKYNVIFMAEGAYKVTGVYFTRKLSAQGSRFMYLDMTKGQTVSYVVLLPQPVILDPGDVVSILVDDYTSTADLRLYMDVTKEEMR